MKRLIFPLLFSFFVLQVSAQENPANLLPLEKRSAHFDSVARHLDLGGVVYAYVDVDGDLSRLVGQVKELLALAQKENPGLRNLPPFLQRLDPEFILDLLGVGNIQAVGLSSFKEGGVFRNKSFVLMKGGPRGLFQIMGGPAHPFATWQMAPAGTDLVWEQDLNLKAVYEMVLAILERTMGPPGLEMAEEVMSQTPNEMDFTWKELITQLDTRLIGIVRMDPNKKLRVPVPGRRTVDSLFKEQGSHHDHIHAPGLDHESDSEAEDEVRRFLEDTDSDEPQPPADFNPGFTVPPPHNVVVPEPRMMEIPLVDFYVSVENLGWLVDQAVKEFENVQEAEILRANGWMGVGFGKQLPPALEGYQPYLLHEQGTGRLVLVSRPEFMNECLANSGGVRQDAHFQQAVQGLPASGNGFTYFSPEIIDVIGGVVADIAEGEDEARAALPWLLKLLGHLKQPQAVVYRNQDDGVLVSGNQVFSHKGNFFMALITNPVLLGLMYFGGLQSDHAVGEVFQEADRHGAMENLRLLASVYHEYLDVTNGAHIPADTSGVHAWALALTDKTGFEDASVFRIDGDIAVDGHRGELAESIRQKSFPGSPFSLTLVAGLPRGAPASTTPLAWTRGLRPSGRWKFDAPFYGDGGLILFLDGSVRFFNSVEDALVDYETKEPTSDISKAVPPTAKILEYDLPELELQLEVPRDSLPKLQIPSDSDGIPLDSLRNPGVLEPAIESVPPGFERFLAPAEVEPEAPKPPE